MLWSRVARVGVAREAAHSQCTRTQHHSAGTEQEAWRCKQIQYSTRSAVGVTIKVCMVVSNLKLYVDQISAHRVPCIAVTGTLWLQCYTVEAPRFDKCSMQEAEDSLHTQYSGNRPAPRRKPSPYPSPSLRTPAGALPLR